MLCSYDTWFEGLAKEYKKRDMDVDFPSPAPPSAILTVSLQQRLQMLRNLCDFHLEQCDHFWQLVKDGDAEDALRLECIGLDAQSRRYWIFSDARMYRDKVAIKNAVKRLGEVEDESNWELVCLTRADYEEFLQNGLSSKPKDRALAKLINQEWMPELEKTLNYQLSQHRKYFRPVSAKQELLLPRKRSSRLVEKELVEMQRREAEEEARKERERQKREARAVLIGKDFNLPPTVPTESRDLALQRELRARERELKKEREAQVRAIEEAFFSQMVDVEAADPNLEQPEVATKHSPIKLVLKLNSNSIDVDTVPVDVVEMLSSNSQEIDIEESETKAEIDVVEDVNDEMDKSWAMSEQATKNEALVEESNQVTEPYEIIPNATVEESSEGAEQQQGTAFAAAINENQQSGDSVEVRVVNTLDVVMNSSGDSSDVPLLLEEQKVSTQNNIGDASIIESPQSEGDVIVDSNDSYEQNANVLEDSRDVAEFLTLQSSQQ